MTSRSNLRLLTHSLCWVSPLLFFLPFECPLAASAPPAAGIVVDKIRRGSDCDKAGLLPGDILLSWRRQTTALSKGETGKLESPFDFAQLLIDQTPRGAVHLRGLRGRQERSWTLPRGSPTALTEVVVFPQLESDLDGLFQGGKALVASGAIEAGFTLLRAAARQAGVRGQKKVGAWFSLYEARTLERLGKSSEADSIYQNLTNTFAALPGERRAAAQILREWGESLLLRRKWSQSAHCYGRALSLDRQAGAPSLAEALSLTGLGNLANWSAGSENPDAFFLKALAIRRRLAPSSCDIASTWFDRGQDSLTSRDYRAAKKRFRLAANIARRLSCNKLYFAEKLYYVGLVEFYLGNLGKAAKIWTQTLALAEREAPADVVTAASLQALGRIETKREHRERGEELLMRALTDGRESEMTPLFLAEVLQDLGAVQRQMGKTQASSSNLCRSLDLVEKQRKRFEGDQETQLRLGYVFADQYRACAQSLIETGNPEKAFDILELGRGRSVIDRLSDQSGRKGDLTPDQVKESQRLEAEYDRVQRSLDEAHLRNVHGQRILDLEGQQREIRRRSDQILGERSAKAGHSEPLNLAKVTEALDPATVLAFFATAKDETFLFVVSPGAQSAAQPAVFPIAVGREELTKGIGTFRDSLLDNRLAKSGTETLGSRLYDLLLGPADSLLARAERLLIVPDGPLHTLPFAALVRDGRYLAEWKPLHFAASATAYAEQLWRRQPAADPAKKQLVAFGDPLYPGPQAHATGIGDASLRDALRRGLVPLPASRREVEEISALFPHSQTFLGAEATEQRAKELGQGVDILHFAVHGLLNERTPQNSALALSPPRPGERGNGFLQAWEIAQDMHLDADLVTLSACDTALGRDMGGEGLLGLTRAFQLAGARSVLATLWGASDKSAASLMVSFYRGLQARKTKDEALRQAQLEQIRAGREPFYWADYQLYGDWR